MDLLSRVGSDKSLGDETVKESGLERSLSLILRIKAWHMVAYVHACQVGYPKSHNSHYFGTDYSTHASCIPFILTISAETGVV